MRFRVYVCIHASSAARGLLFRFVERCFYLSDRARGHAAVLASRGPEIGDGRGEIVETTQQHLGAALRTRLPSMCPL